MISLLYKLFDAFAELIEPLIARLMLRRRWVVAQEGEGFGFYEVVGSRVILRARSDTDEKALRLFRRASGGLVELRIRDDQVLHRMLRLPQAGRDFLEPIIEHRLERLVPWRPERVLYGFRAVGDVDANGSLAVEFAATSEDAVSELLKHLDALKLTPTALGTTAQVLTAPPSIDLYRGRRSAGAPARQTDSVDFPRRYSARASSSLYRLVLARLRPHAGSFGPLRSVSKQRAVFWRRQALGWHKNATVPSLRRSAGKRPS
jgi:general secretion pathway protein L